MLNKAEHDSIKSFCKRLDKFCADETLDFESLFYKLAEVFKQDSNINTHPVIKSLLDTNAELCNRIAFNIYASYK